tara:strand:+ start:67 stop:1035 length:969 start_codon:yes stop_codon:yes gene_type:complete
MDNLNKKVLKSTSKKESKFYCEKCDYVSSNSSNYNKHLSTRKHILNASLNEKYSEHICEYCNKVYKNRNGLWYHKKKCIQNPDINNTEDKKENEIECKIIENKNDKSDSEDLMYKDMFLSMVQENKEMRKTIQDLIPKIGHNNVTNMYQSNTTNHNHFNMNIFLNTQCKNALNLVDFVDSLELQLSDLENTGKYGFVEGMSKIFIRGLQELDVYKRPIHCSDSKRDILYVKENNEWNRENEDYSSMKEAISNVKRKNLVKVEEFVKDNPEIVNNPNESKKYIDILSNSIGVEENKDKDIQKIIKNVAKEVILDKKIDKKNTL